MGWIRSIHSSQASQDPAETDLNVNRQHVKNGKPGYLPKQCLFQALSMPDAELPFISASEVAARRPSASASESAAGETWIVINSIVYDCTGFLNSHPGGDAVIRSFQGEDCSWQFWRFHTKQDLERHGRPLRVGRTEGVTNRFREPKKFVGLRTLGADDDWD